MSGARASRDKKPWIQSGKTEDISPALLLGSQGSQCMDAHSRSYLDLQGQTAERSWPLWCWCILCQSLSFSSEAWTLSSYVLEQVT